MVGELTETPVFKGSSEGTDGRIINKRYQTRAVGILE